MFKEKPILTGQPLLDRCQAPGISINNIWNADHGIVSGDTERELQQLVLNVEAAQRASRLWLFAFISAIASALSAGAAWLAVFVK